MSTSYCTALFDNLFEQFDVCQQRGRFASKILQFLLVVCCPAGSPLIWGSVSSQESTVSSQITGSF